MALPAEEKAYHKKLEICTTRPSYRDGREPKAVKVYTVSQESKHLLILGVPALGAAEELVKMFALYGTIQEYNQLNQYPCEQYTEAYVIKFQNIQAARFAKKKLDDTNFYGGCLHICYAPEHETVDDVREKLTQRKKSVTKRLREIATENAKAAGKEACFVPASGDSFSPVASTSGADDPAPQVTYPPFPHPPFSVEAWRPPPPPTLPSPPRQSYRPPPSRHFSPVSKPTDPLIREHNIIPPRSRFIPRQLTKPTTSLPKHCLTNNKTENVGLKRKALELRDEVAGPSLPVEEEAKRALKREDGNSSLDATVLNIRERVMQFSCRALPPQVKKRKKDDAS